MYTYISLFALQITVCYYIVVVMSIYEKMNDTLLKAGVLMDAQV